MLTSILLDADLTPFLNNVCAFIDLHREKKLPVLVYSDLGYSRAAAVCIAYLMHINPTKPTVQVAQLILFL